MDRTLPATAALLALLLFLPTPVLAEEATVTLSVDARLTFPYDEPAFLAGCPLTVPAGTSAGVLLDLATATGCLDGWAYASFGFGRYVTAITGPGAGDATNERAPSCPGTIGYWSFWVNGAMAPYGIDDYAAAAGDEVLLHYQVDDGCLYPLSLAGFFAGVRAASPVPLSGPL